MWIKLIFFVSLWNICILIIRRCRNGQSASLHRWFCAVQRLQRSIIFSFVWCVWRISNDSPPLLNLSTIIPIFSFEWNFLCLFMQMRTSPGNGCSICTRLASLTAHYTEIQRTRGCRSWWRQALTLRPQITCKQDLFCFGIQRVVSVARQEPFEALGKVHGHGQLRVIDSML